MNPRSIIRSCYDLKRPYQRNVMIGFGISGMLYICIASMLFLFCSEKGTQVGIPRTFAPDSIHFTPPSPIPVSSRPRPAGGEAIKPKIGIPRPVPDSQANFDPSIPTQRELIEFNPNTPVESLGTGIQVNFDTIANLLPSLDTFIPYETAPVQIDFVKPIYPDLAMRAGIEGKVWLRALVDRDGKVREVRVEKSTNPNAGFEEAAIKSAWQTVWRPAIANGLPIAVPITSAVDFKLK